MIQSSTRYILCLFEVSPEEIDSIISPFCAGVITERGGMTSHAAVICRGAGIQCVSSLFDATTSFILN